VFSVEDPLEDPTSWVELGSDPREIELAAEELGHAFGLGFRVATDTPRHLRERLEGDDHALALRSCFQTPSIRPLTRSTADSHPCGR
jgi:hypothetical protein